ncbi:MAG: TauD/TfdA family dioxygenase [Pseudomonadota bacterium]|nr:TauD/TfdA family dioxygenase [Pseudomonadota bacterium]
MDYQTITVTPAAGALGAEVSGIDLAPPLSDRAFDELHHAFTTHMVLMFRDQNLTPEQQVAFGARFGPIYRVPYVEHLADHPDIIAVLKEADEQKIFTFGGTWHTDFSFLPEPPASSLLYALDVPETGGDTIWANMTAAYDTLSDGLKASLDGMVAIHTGAPHGTKFAPPPDMAVSRSIKMSRGDPAADNETEHPVVRIHPVSDAKGLFINPVYTVRFKGMTEAESRPLLDYLCAHAVRPEFTCRLSWRQGSMAMWDNRCTQHLAVNDYDGQRRLLHRITIAGERPVGPD